MQLQTTTDRIFGKPDSILMKRMPLAVLSFADNKYSKIFRSFDNPRKQNDTNLAESGVLCKKIDNSAHFVDLSQQALGKLFWKFISFIL